MILIEESFDMAHRCQGHGYGEDAVHGHTWKISLTLKQREDADMLFEPERLRAVVQKNVVGALDHALLVHQGDDLHEVYVQLQRRSPNVFFVDFIPTAYNLAHYFFRELEQPLYDEGCDIVSVRLYEGQKYSTVAMSGVMPE